MTLVDSLRNVQTVFRGRDIPLRWFTVRNQFPKTFTERSAAFRVSPADVGDGRGLYAFSSWNRRPEQDSEYTNYWRSL